MGAPLPAALRLSSHLALHAGSSYARNDFPVPPGAQSASPSEITLAIKVTPTRSRSNFHHARGDHVTKQIKAAVAADARSRPACEAVPAELLERLQDDDRGPEEREQRLY